MIKNKLFLINIILFIYIFLLNLYYPLISDDFVRINISTLDNKQLFNQLNIDYHYLTGRLIAQLLIYLVFNKSILTFTVILTSLISSFCYVIFNYITYIFIFKSNKISINSYILITILLILYYIKIHSFEEIIEQKTMSIQYLWGFTLMLSILYKFKEIFSFKSIFLTIMYFIVGILLGTYNEILNLLFLVCIIYLAIIFYSKQNQINKLLIAFILGLIIGFIFMIISPGSAERKANAILALANKHLYFTVVEKFVFPFKSYFTSFKGRLLLGIVLLIIMRAIKNKSFKIFNEENILIILFLVSLVILIPFAFCYEGWIGGRVALVPDILLFIIFLKLFFQIFNVYDLFERFNYTKSYIIIFVLFLLTTLVPSYSEFKFNKQNENEMLFASDKATRNFKFKPYICGNKIFGKLSLSSDFVFNDDPTFWANKVAADFYGVKSIIKTSCN